MAISRRVLLAAPALIALLPAPTRALPDAKIHSGRLASLESRTGGRLGVAMFDTHTQTLAMHRGDERFAMCSTFKFLAAAAVLARVDTGDEDLERRIVYGEEKLLPWSPVTEEHADELGMTLAELCEAAVAMSDNTAANLLLEALGGPQAVTEYARSLGDEITRLDRYEPDLNNVPPGDVRDTTTPRAMLGNLQKIVLGDALSDASRQRISGWLIGSRTGDKRLRAGFPAGWRIGDKTGTSRSVTGDIAVAWAPERKALIVSAYFDAPRMSAADREAVLRDVGKIAAELAAS
ncbi:class A beta-lactamase [Chelativorans sp. AA-79]|uniref:class A beta-lactamase n=1 Tax=Chelativorans sp. AA-79 TaxID=3028735 RepID=UPI0023F8EF59|nr:class A beta-lactamase [Chelativorans sp. AA-79]WEX07966.1 class A beta-lactamase [Chelativorans sp. AA-79]